MIVERKCCIMKKVTKREEGMEFLRIRRLLSCARRAVDDYNMIEEGDRIAVGVSAFSVSSLLRASSSARSASSLSEMD